MFEFFPNCIFCNSVLPVDRTDVGEHIFPESIYGFWRSHDVCLNCQQSMGNEVDILAIQNVQLLNAMEILKLKDTSRHLDHLTWSGEDTLDKRKVPMIKRGPNFRIKVVKSDDFLECSESNLEMIAKPWLRQITLGKLSDEKFNEEYLKFTDAYFKLSPGELYHSDVFGYSIRRSQTNKLRVDNPIPSSFTRLIAKIMVYFLHYSFTHRMLSSITELQLLKDHALFGKPLPQFTINPLRPLEEGKYFPFHRIVIYPDTPTTLVDTTFFGNIGWRTVLHSHEPLFIVNHSGEKAELMLYVLNFSDLANKKKHVGFKYFNIEEIDWRDVNG